MRRRRIPWLLFLPLLGGCLCGGYPRLDRTPEMHLDNVAAEVHAFRVDVSHNDMLPVFDLISNSPTYNWKLQESRSADITKLSIEPDGTVPAQLKASLCYTLFYPMIVVNAFQTKGHSLAVRLYRPGYALLEVRSWGRGDPIVWRWLTDVKEQVKAVDALLADQTFAKNSPIDRHTLLFAAAEYERLAGIADDADRRMLRHKAETLRARADGKEVSGDAWNGVIIIN